MSRIFMLIALLLILAGCQTAPDNPASPLSAAVSVSNSRSLDDRTCPTVDVEWPADRGTILMYEPGTVSQFTVSARIREGDSDSLWVYLLISRFDGGTADLALTGYADRYDPDGFCYFTFYVDAADLQCACEHELTAIVMDVKGCYDMDRQTVNFLWE